MSKGQGTASELSPCRKGSCLSRYAGVVFTRIPCLLYLRRPMSSTDTQTIIYEQPLNERIRALLRLEHLLDSVEANLSAETGFACRTAIAGMLDITDLMGRFDIKAELVKELERQSNAFSALRQNPGVDPARLQEVLDELNKQLTCLRDTHCQPGTELRRDELLNSIRQRLAIPGGTCSFDLPGYHHWLHRAVRQRSTQLKTWFSDLAVIQQGVHYALSLLRGSAAMQHKQASGGFYQQSSDPDQECQLVRISLPQGSDYFPEISGGKHRFTVRFLHQPSTGSRPVQSSDDVVFGLMCCNM